MISYMIYLCHSYYYSAVTSTFESSVIEYTNQSNHCSYQLWPSNCSTTVTQRRQPIFGWWKQSVAHSLNVFAYLRWACLLILSSGPVNNPGLRHTFIGWKSTTFQMPTYSLKTCTMSTRTDRRRWIMVCSVGQRDCTYLVNFRKRLQFLCNWRDNLWLC